MKSIEIGWFGLFHLPTQRAYNKLAVTWVETRDYGVTIAGFHPRYDRFINLFCPQLYYPRPLPDKPARYTNNLHN